jgi:hypothetical protein
MNISKFFIDRPIFAGVLSVLILLAGIIALFQLPISEYPEVVPPSVVVKAQYPGANPKVIAEAVASPLEEQINGVENMLYMQSQANSDGNLTLTVTFALGTNPDLATQLVQNRVNQALPRLPEDVQRLGVTTIAAARECARASEDRERIRRHRREDGARWRGDVPARYRAHRTRGVRIRPAFAARQQAGRCACHQPVAGRELAADFR